ncbi:YccF domain-containing protein [Aeromonas caviae]|uniref:YccF domain-containing protein n=1 Tax=Aeromonas caviae TaxID=648 RepID=UPI001FB8E239|nr:YccF domain-containing protein [Aeromonas caviae]
MSFFRFLFNLLWFVLGGVFMGLAWWLAGLLCFVSLVGIPFGIQHLKLALISLAPIGQMIVTNHEAESGRYIR